MSHSGVLSMCATCRHAEWKKTASGRRHPDGTGRCAFEFPESPLPKWAVESDYGRNAPMVTTLRRMLERKLHGRWIYWREAHQLEPTPCATWEVK